LPRLPKYGRLTKIFSTSFALPWARFVSQNRSNSEVRMQWLATMTRAWFSALITLAWGDAQQEWIPATKHWKMLMTKDHTMILTIDSSLLSGSICVWILQPLSIHIRQDDLDIGHQSRSWLIENKLSSDHIIPKEMVQIHLQQMFLQAMHWSTSTIRRPWKSEHVQNSSMWLSFTFDTVLIVKAAGTPDPWVRSGWLIRAFALIHLGNEVRTILAKWFFMNYFPFLANIDRPVSVYFGAAASWSPVSVHWHVWKVQSPHFQFPKPSQSWSWLLLPFSHGLRVELVDFWF
jgi:hypothetical protein